MDTLTFTQNVERLRTTFQSGKTQSLDWRREQLLALMRMTTDHYADFESAMQADLHKSTFECYATEIGFLQNEAKHALECLDKWAHPLKVHTPVFLQPGASRVIYEPLGVALIMGAWNYPLQLTLGPLVPAIAAGNAGVIKPPRTAAATFKAIAAFLPQYLDQEAFLVVDEDTSNELILSQRWDKIFFTGSAEVGKIVMQAAAAHLTPITLELGGKSPTLVDHTANLRVAARRIAQGKFFNAGQTCVAPDYILVEETVQEPLIAELVRAIGEFFGEDPRQSNEFARIINTRQFDCLVKFFADGEIVCGGQTDREERYIAPTILKNVSPESPVMQDEIFGPILPILPVKNMDEALHFVRQREKPLAFYIFSEDRQTVEKILSQSTSGGVCVNDTINHLAVPDLPFGGVGNSGMGKYHGEWGFHEFSNPRAVLDQSSAFDPDLRYPPFAGEKFTRIRNMMNMHSPAALDGLLAWLMNHWGNTIVNWIR